MAYDEFIMDVLEKSGKATSFFKNESVKDTIDALYFSFGDNDVESTKKRTEYLWQNLKKEEFFNFVARASWSYYGNEAIDRVSSKFHKLTYSCIMVTSALRELFKLMDCYDPDYWWDKEVAYVKKWVENGGWRKFISPE